VKIKKTVNRPAINNSRGIERTRRKEKEVLSKKREKTKKLSMRNHTHQIVQYPLSQGSANFLGSRAG